MTPEERLATLEQEMRDVREDMREIKNSLKILETLASRGNGALTTLFHVGSVVGWIMGIGSSLILLFRH